MNNNQQNFEFLDIITILSFAMQLMNNDALTKQATNNDLLAELHKDVDILNSKLDRLLALVGDNNTNAGKRPSNVP